MSDRIGREVDFEIDSQWDTRDKFDVVNMEMNNREAVVLIKILLDQLEGSKKNKGIVKVRSRGRFKSKV